MSSAAQLMTEREAADYLGVAEGTLRNWRSRHPDRLPARKNGRMVRYQRSTVEEFFESKKPGAGTPGQNRNA